MTKLWLNVVWWSVFTTHVLACAHTNTQTRKDIGLALLVADTKSHRTQIILSVIELHELTEIVTRNVQAMSGHLCC